MTSWARYGFFGQSYAETDSSFRYRLIRIQLKKKSDCSFREVRKFYSQTTD